MHVESSNSAPPMWNEYVGQHPLATAYHRAAAVCIGEQAFGLRTIFLTVWNDDGRLTGVLPLVEQSSALFGRFLVSLPFVTYGGILADDPASAVALAEYASQEARMRRANHVELRHVTPLGGVHLAESLDKVSMLLSLPTSEVDLAKSLGAKLRSQIRRAERERLEFSWGGAESIPDFYRVFARGMRDLGTPVYSRRFFEVTYAALKDLADVLVVRMRGAVHAAAFLVQHGHTIEVPWAIASQDAKRLSVNMKMYWELLRRAIERGVATFDFGRSSINSGTYRFKAQWGAQPKQLHWHYWLSNGTAVPKLNQSNPKYARAAALWKRMPLCCANLIGPHIVRNLP